MKLVKLLALSLGCLLSSAKDRRDTPQEESTLYKDDKCRILTMRGGGTKGAYEIGVLLEMTEHVDPKEMEYDVVEGISIGALNAALIATFPKGEEKEALRQAKELWMNHPVTEFWQNWPILGPVDSLWKPSLLDNQNMKDFVTDTIGPKKLKRGFVVKAVDMKRGGITVFDETISQEDFPRAVVASASVPVFFSPEEVQDGLYIDGGTFSNLEIEEGILKCRENGFEDKDIIVDIILCFDKIVQIENWSMTDATYKNAYDLFKRKTEYKDFYYYFEEILRVLRGFPDIYFRHLIAPLAPLGGGLVPIFDGIDVVEKLLEQGKQDARTIFGGEGLNKTNSTSGEEDAEQKPPTVRASWEDKPQFLTFDLLQTLYEGEL